MNRFKKIAGSLLIILLVILILVWSRKHLSMETVLNQHTFISTTIITPTASPIEHTEEGQLGTLRPSSLPAEGVMESTPQPSVPAPFSSPSPSNSPESSEVPAIPSYESLLSEADTQILALRSQAQSELLDLMIAYQATEAAKEKSRLKAQGISMMSGYDATFATILKSFELHLKQYGYDAAIIASYKLQYTQEKQLAQAFLNP